MAPPNLLWNPVTAGSSSGRVIIVIVRELIARLVFSLGIDHILSMEIVAFWLWIQGNGHLDFLARINCFSDSRLCEIASAGNRLIEALYRRESPAAAGDPLLISTGAGRSTQQPSSSYFQKEALEGIAFYLNNVCIKAFQDLLEMEKMKEEAMYGAGRHHKDRKGKQVAMSTRDLLSKIRSAYVAQGSEEASSSGTSMLSPKGRILHDVKHTTDVHPPRYDLASLMGNLSIRDRPDQANQQRSRVPADERTLFVTFSNGYPFTKDELYDFFMRHYGDVEEVNVEEPVESRPPLYAHVTFFSQRTLFQVLDGNPRVKFMTRGKHLWARQYVPKKKKVAG